MHFRRSALVIFALFVAIPLLADKVLIISETGNASSLEATEALSQLPPGSTVDVLSLSAVNALVASGPGALSGYRVVIFADPNCGESPQTPVLNPGWANDITGNVIIIGTDQVLHAASGGAALVDKAMAFVLSDPNPGAFISLSCYYDYPFPAPPGTPVPLLDNGFASSAGSFTVHGTSTSGCFDDAHITATHPAMSGLTDADLANWGCSVHEAFDTWPADFEVLAIAKNSGSSYPAPDGTVGSPYILVRGEDIEVLSDITLTPETATNKLGDPHTVTATIDPAVPGVTVTFTVVAGPNVGLTGTAVTNAAGQATFTYTSSLTGTDYIVAQFTSEGVTQKSNTASKEWVHTPEACMRIVRSEIRCETDATGKPTGNYVWTFQVRNLSGTPVAHLFLSGLPSPATATPDHLIFNPPLASGGVSAPQQVILTNAAPGPLTLLVSLHDATLNQCCSASVTLDLPDCDCAQIADESLPSCFPSVPPPYKYTFTVQNLSSIIVQKVLVAAVSPIDLITPVDPAQLQVTAAVNAVSPTGQGQVAGPLTLLIGGPLAKGGQKVCVNISLTDEKIDACCAITRCFTLPDCGVAIDDSIDVLAAARLTPVGAGFRIDNIGGSGEDGIRIDTGEAERVGLAWQPLDAAAPNGAFVELRAATSDPEANGRLRVTKSAAGYEISTTISGTQRYRVEVYRGGALAGSATQTAGINVIVIWPVAGGAEIVRLLGEQNHGDTLGFTLDAGRSIAWRLADGTTLTGDRFRIRAEQPLVHDGLHIESFELRAANLREIVVTGISVATDCNRNGIADAEDIARGTSLDQNGNGIPDECDGSANMVVLDTGSDDEWRIVSPAPERAAVVVQPQFSGWPAPLPRSRWISANANGASLPGVSSIAFQRCFCLADDADEVTLDLALRADDRAVVSLNGRALAAGGEFFAAEPLRIRRTGAAGDGWFVAGQNCLRVEVLDPGSVVTGLTLAGTMTASGSACSHHD